VTSSVFSIWSVVFLLGTACSSAAEGEACEGQDRGDTIAALDALQVDDFSCGLAQVDPNGLLACIEDAAQRANQRRAGLTTACQKLYDDVLRAAPVGGGSNETGARCASGVCCDQSGCYD